jgi:hypothetical protein
MLELAASKHAGELAGLLAVGQFNAQSPVVAHRRQSVDDRPGASGSPARR